MNESTHEPFDGLASLYALGALAERDRAAFEEHLDVCRTCADEILSLLPVSHGLARIVPQQDAPPALRDRVVPAVNALPTTTVADDALRTAKSPVAKAPPVRRKKGISSVLFGLAAAACLVAAGGLGWYAAQQVNLARVLRQNLDAANLRANIAGLEATTAQQIAEEARRRVAIFAAPDLRSIRLASQPAAPDASGRAFWSPSRGVIFTAAGLPFLPAGRIYQVWLVHKATPVSAGLLRVNDAGRVTATIEVPKEITEPVPMAVTLEPEGGVPSPTGAVYLIGRPSA